MRHNAIFFSSFHSNPTTKIGKSSRINKEAVEGCHCKHIALAIEIQGIGHPVVVHFPQRHEFPIAYFPFYSLLFVVQLVLRIGSISDID